MHLLNLSDIQCDNVVERGLKMSKFPNLDLSCSYLLCYRYCLLFFLSLFCLIICDSVTLQYGLTLYLHTISTVDFVFEGNKLKRSSRCAALYFAQDATPDATLHALCAVHAQADTQFFWFIFKLRLF